MVSPRKGASHPRTLEQVFGQVLRSVREERGLSQEQLGQAAESGRTYISQLERGEKGPSLKMVFRLARHLGTSPAEIVRRVQGSISDEA